MATADYSDDEKPCDSNPAVKHAVLKHILISVISNIPPVIISIKYLRVEKYC
jgi:hypothetical protein